MECKNWMVISDGESIQNNNNKMPIIPGIFLFTNACPQLQGLCGGLGYKNKWEIEMCLEGKS